MLGQGAYVILGPGEPVCCGQEPSFVFCNHTIILIKYIIVADLRMKRVWGDRTPREGKGAKGFMRRD
jgi:hypothetical protein